MISNKFDVIVVGGGHAGVEAAYAAARLGSKTALITLDINKIGLMPCNPAIGGIGKGHIVFEISALGGLMPKLCTDTYLQARMLNTRKGPAVQGLRLQIDKVAYSNLSQEILKKTPNIEIISDRVDEIIIDSENQIQGVKTRLNKEIFAPSVILTTGTFLAGLVHMGHKNFAAGRQDEEAVYTLSDFLKTLNLEMVRLKTGTPPRLLRSSLDFSKMEEQLSDDLEYLFEFEPHKIKHKASCYLTRTNATTHQIIKDNFELSPIFTGHIKGTPPRYCPSIEDKISRFASKDSHHVFVEPESLSHDLMYPNGLSTSLPVEVQEKFIRSIEGFENAIIAKPGYAIEYDCVLPHQLKHTLELKRFSGLFLAGQINGTTGYEEAAGQGIIAGINAHSKAHNKPDFILSRHESYIGIMIDDLVTLGVDEPYRMFTSRAEHRLLLRQDNVFERLSQKAFEFGLINREKYEQVLTETKIANKAKEYFSNPVRNKEISQLLSSAETDGTEKVLNLIANFSLINNLGPIPYRTTQTIYAELLYGPYIKREEKEIEKAAFYQTLLIPKDFTYNNIPGLSIELQQKLNKYKPQNIAQVSLIKGMTPAALSLLIFKVRQATQDISC